MRYKTKSNGNQDDFLENLYENGQSEVMKNFEKSWKSSWKVMEFQQRKRVRTLSIHSNVYKRICMFLYDSYIVAYYVMYCKLYNAVSYSVHVLAAIQGFVRLTK